MNQDRHGNSIVRHSHKSKRPSSLLFEAARSGDVVAQSSLGFWYFSHAFSTKHRREAVKWLRKAAQAGDKYGQYNLGVALFDPWAGRMVSKQEAFAWLRRSAKQGYPEALCNLGVAFELGLSTEADGRKAFKHYEKAHLLGDPLGGWNLGRCLQLGVGARPSSSEAQAIFSQVIPELRKLAQKGEAQAQMALGKSYVNGWGVRANKRHALTWYRKAASLGDHEGRRLAKSIESSMRKTKHR